MFESLLPKLCLAPRDEIIKFAEGIDADLIVVGSHGNSNLARFVLGSVSQSVCSGAACSVVVVRKQGKEKS